MLVEWLLEVYPLIYNLLAPVCENQAAIAYEAPQPGGKLPDEFIVVSKIAGSKGGFYSGKPRRTNMLFQVSYVARDRSKLESKLQEIVAAMTRGGFLHAGEGPDLENPATGHWSTSCDFRLYTEERGMAPTSARNRRRR